MHVVERFWNHLRNADNDDIAFSLYTGFMVIATISAVILFVWLLVELLGVFVVGLPLAIVAALLIFYGIGHYIVKRFDL